MRGTRARAPLPPPGFSRPGEGVPARVTPGLVPDSWWQPRAPEPADTVPPAVPVPVLLTAVAPPLREPRGRALPTLIAPPGLLAAPGLPPAPRTAGRGPSRGKQTVSSATATAASPNPSTHTTCPRRHRRSGAEASRWPRRPPTAACLVSAGGGGGGSRAVHAAPTTHRDAERPSGLQTAVGGTCGPCAGLRTPVPERKMRPFQRRSTRERATP
ncbi:hypothetical protein HJG60_008961 [Phyllostomus discolor]|uniref:Uncharacterized protein n=1 Tax=Phyllostomus discolor TaxID=89673 RepID=A0A833YMN4_9CHIR|nr:hypothetical protein HJG60_008961 [Phyllostomus discolor]